MTVKHILADEALNQGNDDIYKAHATSRDLYPKITPENGKNIDPSLESIKTERRSSPETQLTEFSLSQLRKEFVNLFSGQGFTVQKAVDVSSGGDSTVLFIGSNISALKGIVLGDVPPEGVVIDLELPRKNGH